MALFRREGLLDRGEKTAYLGAESLLLRETAMPTAMPRRRFSIVFCLRLIIPGAIAAGLGAFQVAREENQEMWRLWLALTILGAFLLLIGLGLLALAWKKPKHVRLGSILRWRHRLSDTILQEIADKARAQGKYLGEMAVELNYITSDELAAALRDQKAMNEA